MIHRWIEGSIAPNRPAELYDVVWQQIDAVRMADWPRAYRQVSSSFADKYNVDAFTELARAEYPGLRSIDHVEFGRIGREGSRAMVHAYFVFENGHVVPCIYRLVLEDNVWKIDSAQILQSGLQPQRLSGMRL